MADTSDILQQILAHKAEEIIDLQRRLPLTELKHHAADCASPRGFFAAVNRAKEANRTAVIAEIKRASPSKGLICKDFDPEKIARTYAEAGADCLSILTDKQFFQGDNADLETARSRCTIPILRKDFIIEPYQIYESRVIGADCILLIVAAVSDAQLQELAGIAGELDLDVLVEVHDREELERGLMLRKPLLGINNRNLRNFTTDISVTIDLLTDMPYDRIVIAESGIHSNEQVKILRKYGVHGFLVGEALMSSADPSAALKELFCL